MKIYLDGVDGAGKSTLANYLSQYFKIDKFCLTKDSEKSIDRYLEVRSIDNVVYDRTFLSEVVYPEIFNRKPWMSESDIKMLLDIYKKDIFIILTADIEDIRQRIFKRGDEFEEVIRQLELINNSYLEIAKKYDLLLINTSITSFKDVVDMIERRLHNG